jgi:uncharacterized protein YecT (DUF1311 family)
MNTQDRMPRAALIGLVAVVCGAGAWTGAARAEPSPQCKRLSAVPFPAADQPTAADRAAPGFKTCSSWSLYYGLGGKADPAAARKCAFRERVDSPRMFPTGTWTLIMLYGNGWGTPYNYTLAMKAYCESTEDGYFPEFPPVEQKLQRFQARGAKAGASCVSGAASPKGCGAQVDLCDPQALSSGVMTGICASKDSDLKELGAAKAFNEIVARWPAVDRAAFKTLETRRAAYADAHAFELDRTGTIRYVQDVEERDALLADFRAVIRRFETGARPAPANRQAADAEMNRVYQKILAAPQDADGYGSTVGRNDVRNAQRAWLGYRDAFLAFAKVHYPTMSQADLEAQLIRGRIAKLNALPPLKG